MISRREDNGRIFNNDKMTDDVHINYICHTITTMQNYHCLIIQSNVNDVRDFLCILHNKFVLCTMYNVVTCDVNLLSKPRVSQVDNWHQWFFFSLHLIKLEVHCASRFKLIGTTGVNCVKEQSFFLECLLNPHIYFLFHPIIIICYILEKKITI